MPRPRLCLSRLSRRMVLPPSADPGAACSLRAWLAVCSLQQRLVLRTTTCPAASWPRRSGDDHDHDGVDYHHRDNGSAAAELYLAATATTAGPDNTARGVGLALLRVLVGLAAPARAERAVHEPDLAADDRGVRAVLHGAGLPDRGPRAGRPVPVRRVPERHAAARRRVLPAAVPEPRDRDRGHGAGRGGGLRRGLGSRVLLGGRGGARVGRATCWRRGRGRGSAAPDRVAPRRRVRRDRRRRGPGRHRPRRGVPPARRRRRPAHPHHAVSAASGGPAAWRYVLDFYFYFYYF